MNKLTYRQAYDKIIEAYFRDEIKPFDCEFCFCGSLAGGFAWVGGDKHYSYQQYERMERALLNQIKSLHHEFYEDGLFSGMCAAIEVLKQIHRERGEDVDEVPVFNKRELKTV